MRGVSLVVFALSGLALASAASISGIVYFSGGMPTCSQCGTVGQYACSELGIGRWNNGTVKCRDLLPAGAILQELSVTLIGSFGCDTKRDSPTVRVTMGDTVIGITSVPTSSQTCKCGTCDAPVVFTQTYPGGFPNYVYGGENELQIQSLYNFICLNAVRMNATYTFNRPADTVYSTVTPFYDSSTYSACSACDALRRISCYDRSTYTYTFKDFLPSPSILLAVRLGVYGKFFCLNPNNGSFTTTVDANLQGNLIETRDISTPRAQCPCLGCDGGLLFSSQSVHQGGWPGYTYGGTNSITIRARNNRICMGRLDIALIYYSTGSNSVQTATLSVPQAN